MNAHAKANIYRSPITHHELPITQKNELEYFDMNAMPRVIPMCPNTNMVYLYLIVIKIDWIATRFYYMQF
ncbi:hypothetical protein C5S29_08220 [ANME-1 cluster archaeon GoMg3.2]|jgi:hypothetical protein|nr:hypothetical protein [ANME-1 cluster archaeon GoMg3.2]